MISFYLKWTFTEYKELLSIGLDRIKFDKSYTTMSR